MANITKHSELNFEEVDVSSAGKQRFLFTNAIFGKSNSQYLGELFNRYLQFEL